MIPAAALALLLASGALPREPAPTPEMERCLALAEHLKGQGYVLDDLNRTFTLEEARELARGALREAGGSAGQGGLRLPFLERFVQHADHDETRRELAERLLFAAERLASTCRLLGESQPAPAQVAPGLAVSILSRPEYELASRDEQFLARLLQRLWTWLRDVFAESAAVQQTALSIRALFLVATCLALAYVAFRLSRFRLARRRRPSAAPAEALVLDDPARYQREAEQALGRGDGREAIRGSLLALLAALERARLAAPGRAATNREVAEHIAARGGPAALSRAVGELVGFYDRAWYSLSPVGREEAEKFLAASSAARGEAERFQPAEAA